MCDKSKCIESSLASASGIGAWNSKEKRREQNKCVSLMRKYFTNNHIFDIYSIQIESKSAMILLKQNEHEHMNTQIYSNRFRHQIIYIGERQPKPLPFEKIRTIISFNDDKWFTIQRGKRQWCDACLLIDAVESYPHWINNIKIQSIQILFYFVSSLFCRSLSIVDANSNHNIWLIIQK